MVKRGFIIIGFPKSGQVSLISYLKEKFPNHIIKKDEIVWNEKGIEIFKQKYGHNELIRPVLIFRDPIKRIWSSYWYFHFDGEEAIRDQMTFEEYLHLRRYDFHLGDLNPISGSNYKKWFRRWKELNPLIINFEKLRKSPDFPHLNKTEDERKIKIPEMTKEQFELTRRLLNEVS